MTTARPRTGGRSARVVAAAHAATLELLEEAGYEGFQLVDVAERAGVHKSTIYRRWPTKAALVGDVLAKFTRLNVATPDSGSLATDLELLLSEIAEAVTDGAMRAILHAAVTISDLNVEVRHTRQRFWDERFRRSGAIVDKAIRRGELPSDVDPRLFLEIATSPIFFRALLTSETIDHAFIAFLTRQTIQSFRGSSANN